MPRRRRTFPLLMLIAGVGFLVYGLGNSDALFGIGISAIWLALLFLRQDSRSLIDAADMAERRRKLIEARDNLLAEVNKSNRSE